MEVMKMSNRKKFFLYLLQIVLLLVGLIAGGMVDLKHDPLGIARIWAEVAIGPWQLLNAVRGVLTMWALGAALWSFNQQRSWHAWLGWFFLGLWQFFAMYSTSVLDKPPMRIGDVVVSIGLVFLLWHASRGRQIDPKDTEVR
jgi:hypothetical protein